MKESWLLAAWLLLWLPLSGIGSGSDAATRESGVGMRMDTAPIVTQSGAVASPQSGTVPPTVTPVPARGADTVWSYLDEPPWSTRQIAGSFGSLAGLLAGFALTAMILLLRQQQQAEEAVKEQYMHAMLLLFAAFVLGALSSFMFSAMLAGSERSAFVSFSYPSVIFSALTLALASGLVRLFAAFANSAMLRLARLAGYLFALFAWFRIWDNLRRLSEYVGLDSFMWWVLLLTLFFPLAALIMQGIRCRLQQWVEMKTVGGYCFALVSVAAACAFGQSVVGSGQRWLARPAVSEPTILLLMLFLAMCAAWSILLAPAEPVQDAAPAEPVQGT